MTNSLFKPKKILIVDDSITERRASIELLKENHFLGEILEAANGEEALEIISTNYNDIGLILLDWQMPKMDGIQLMKGLIKVKITASIPIILITASGSEEAKISVRRLNPQLAGYIVKPYDSMEFIIKISPYVDFA